MAKILKKITIGNPLANFEMWDELDEYENIEKPEQLAAFYHKLLDNCPEERTLLKSAIHTMIDFSTGDTNLQILRLCEL